MLLYYITDRSQFPGDEVTRRRRLLENIAEAARCGVDYVQIREKDLASRDLEALVREIIELRTVNQQLKTGLLINSRTDIALACRAGGVHLRSRDISPAEARKIWSQSAAGGAARMTVAVSCHTQEEVADAASQGADFAVFGPVFEKNNALEGYAAQKHTAQIHGLEALRASCREKIPILALGGVTAQNAAACMQAGAAGIAGIRLFQENELGEVVKAVTGRQSSFVRRTNPPEY